MSIQLPDEVSKELIAAIRSWFVDNRDEDIGDLQSSFLLEFILAEVGPHIHNQTIRTVQAHLAHVITDLDVTLHEE